MPTITTYNKPQPTTLLSREAWVLVGLGVLSLAVILLSISTGAVHISVEEIFAILLHKSGGQADGFSAQKEVVLWSIRLPRVVLGVFIGSALAISGASLQGLFRNPLVEPGLIGVSNGAAFCAIVVIVFSQSLPEQLKDVLGLYLLPFSAFIGSLVVTLLAYRLSQRHGKTDIALLILAGVAMNALAAALIGLVIYYADDTALRTFTFWSLGDLGGASWQKIGFSLIIIAVPVILLTLFHSQLDALALGEAEAGHLGINVEKIKYTVIILSALAVGASVSMGGTISFVGLVVPHMIRPVFGPGHRLLLPASILLGATLLTLADLLARTVVTPSEIPIGVITALIGAPFFIFLLLQTKQRRII